MGTDKQLWEMAQTPVCFGWSIILWWLILISLIAAAYGESIPAAREGSASTAAYGESITAAREGSASTAAYGESITAAREGSASTAACGESVTACGEDVTAPAACRESITAPAACGESITAAVARGVITALSGYLFEGAVQRWFPHYSIQYYPLLAFILRRPHGMSPRMFGALMLFAVGVVVKKVTLHRIWWIIQLWRNVR